MLLENIPYKDWKIINYRRVGDLVTAEFLHDLYNQAVIELNPVHFRNTVCIVENGMFKSFAPQQEWDYLAEVLGTKLTNSPELREKFSKYLERPQDDLHNLMAELKNKYFISNIKKPSQDTFFDLSQLHFLALDRIYAINLVQFEHALGYAINKLVEEQQSNLDSLLKSSELTISGQEECKAIELSLKIDQREMTIEQAVEQHKAEFGAVNLAYGANEGGFDASSEARIKHFLEITSLLLFWCLGASQQIRQPVSISTKMEL